ncbi:aminotransferase class I/II-fold pyridoxal phosphate-dependent enzyme [Mycoplasmatota bacterium WC44]
MKWRSHGANPDKLYEQFNIPMPKRIIDFSTNTNVLQSRVYNLDIMNMVSNYPDDESRELKEVISNNLDIDKNEILVTNGSNEAIYMITSLYDDVVILQPTYSEYERAVKASNNNYSYIKSIDELKSGNLLILCNPNNPTGNYIERRELEEIIFRCKSLNMDVVIDEAYVDFLNVTHELIDLKKSNNVYLLRSLTKSYHLSGARLGYVISSKDKISILKSKQPTWSVNAVAQAVGILSLSDKDHLQKTKDYYSSETPRVISALIDLGYKILPTKVHYFLLEVSNDESFIRYLLKKGVIVRHTRNFPFLDGKYVRICVREQEQNDKLIRLLKEYKNENTSY